MVPTCLTKCARVPGFPYNPVCFSYELSISPPVLTIVLISPADMPGAPKPSIQWMAEEVLGGCGNDFSFTTVGFQRCRSAVSTFLPASGPRGPSLCFPLILLSSCVFPSPAVLIFF